MDIYKITNKVNNKIYIGKAKNSYIDRFNQHIKNAESLKQSKELTVIDAAIRKYGKENFICEKIDEKQTLEELNLCEQYWIKELHSQDKAIGYNIADGGDGGDIFHTLTKEKQQELISKVKQTKVKNGTNKLSEETKLKIGKANFGKNNYMYHRFGSLHHNFGKKASIETRKKLSDSHKGQIPWNKGIPMSDETKLKVSKSKTGKHIENKNGMHVLCIETGESYISASAAARATKCHYSNIIAVCNKKRETAGGYHWEFID